MAIRAQSFFLDDTAGGTLQTRIKRRVVSGILSGQFRPGQRMPSSRALAQHLGISRITVTIAYADLVADDYLEARGRSGYFVSKSAPVAPDLPPSLPPEDSKVDWSRLFSRRTAGPDPITRPSNWRSYPYPFIYGQTDPTLFDHQNWRLCALQALGQKDFNVLATDQYEDDDPLLVEVILRTILTRRGIAARAENVLITMGAQNALWISAQLLLNQRRTAVIEAPGYPELRKVLQQTRCHTHQVVVDDHGLPPEAIPKSADVVFVTPSHHCPTNVTMPTDRRKALLQLAAKRGFVVVEDDYEFELSFTQAASPSLKSLDRDGLVIHVGSFSKSLFPGLRLGYLIAPEPFIREARLLRGTVLRHPPSLMQRTAAHFLSLGHYETQVNRMRKAYRDRRQAMTRAIAEHGLKVAGVYGDGGSSFWMEAPTHVDTEELALALHKRGVVIEPGRTFFDGDNAPKRFYRLAYSSIDSTNIPRGIAIIAEEMARSGPNGAA